MPESSPPRAWRWLGRLLPGSIRELVYEPACLDLWVRNAQGPSPTGLRALWLWAKFCWYFVAAGWFALPRYVIERGRLTFLGRALGVVLFLTAGFAVVMLVPWLVELPLW